MIELRLVTRCCWYSQRSCLRRIQALSLAWPLWSSSTCTDLRKEFAEDWEGCYFFLVSNSKWPLWTMEAKRSLVSLLVLRRMREVYHEGQSDAYILATETVERQLSSKTIFAETSGKNLPISTHRIVMYREPLLFKLLEKIQTNKTSNLVSVFLPKCQHVNSLIFWDSTQSLALTACISHLGFKFCM